MEKTLSVWRSGSHDRERPAVTWTSSAPGQRGDTASPLPAQGPLGSHSFSLPFRSPAPKFSRPLWLRRGKGKGPRAQAGAGGDHAGGSPAWEGRPPSSEVIGCN